MTRTVPGTVQLWHTPPGCIRYYLISGKKREPAASPSARPGQVTALSSSVITTVQKRETANGLLQRDGTVTYSRERT